MFWPSPSDYSEAVQNPHSAFADAELRDGSVALNSLGLPLVMSGACASVYRITSAGKPWAVRCFFENRRDQHERYEAISNFVCFDDLECTVHFQYLERGIKIRGSWFPILKMEWVEGDTLDQFLLKNSQRDVLRDLSESFREMVLAMRAAGIAHGDLQHGNVMLVKGRRLRLVDYDCMYVPELSGKTSLEIGHKNYQHPRRTGFHFGDYLDNFSAWLIYLSLKALSIDPALMRVANGGDECILFRQGDLMQVERSAIFTAMLNHGQPEVRAAADILRKLLSCSVEIVPGLHASYEEISHLPESVPEIFDMPDPIEQRRVIDHRTGAQAGARSLQRKPLVPPVTGHVFKQSIDDACHHAWLFICSHMSPALCAEELLKDAQKQLDANCHAARLKLNEALDVFVKYKLDNSLLKARLYLLLGHTHLIEGQFERAERSYAQVMRMLPKPQIGARLPEMFITRDPYYEAVFSMILLCEARGDTEGASRWLSQHYDNGNLLSAFESVQKQPLPGVATLDSLLTKYAHSLFQIAIDANSDYPPELKAVTAICEAVLFAGLKRPGFAARSLAVVQTTLLLGLAAFRGSTFTKAERCLEQVLETTLDTEIRKKVILPLVLVHIQSGDETLARKTLRGLAPADVDPLLRSEIGRLVERHHGQLGDLFRAKAIEIGKGQSAIEWYQAAIAVYKKVKDAKFLELADCYAACGEFAQVDKLISRYSIQKGKSWKDFGSKSLLQHARSSVRECITREKLVEAAKMVSRYRLSAADDPDNIMLMVSEASRYYESGDVIKAMLIYCACGVYNESSQSEYASLLEDAVASQSHGDYKPLISLFESCEGPEMDVAQWKSGLIRQLLSQHKRQSALDVLSNLKVTVDGVDAEHLLVEELKSFSGKKTPEELFTIARRYSASSLSDPIEIVCQVLIDTNRLAECIWFGERHQTNIWTAVESNLTRCLNEAIAYENRVREDATISWSEPEELRCCLDAMADIIRRPDRRRKIARVVLPLVIVLIEKARANWPAGFAQKNLETLMTFVYLEDYPDTDGDEAMRLVVKCCATSEWDGFTFKLATNIMKKMAVHDNLSPKFCQEVAETIRRSDVLESDTSIWQLNSDLSLLIELFEKVPSNENALEILSRLWNWSNRKIAQQKDKDPAHRDQISSFES